MRKSNLSRLMKKSFIKFRKTFRIESYEALNHQEDLGNLKLSQRQNLSIRQRSLRPYNRKSAISMFLSKNLLQSR